MVALLFMLFKGFITKISILSFVSFEQQSWRIQKKVLVFDNGSFEWCKLQKYHLIWLLILILSGNPTNF